MEPIVGSGKYRYRVREDWQQLLDSLARLYVSGNAVNWAALDDGHVRERLPLPTYPFQRQRYWFSESTDTVIAPLREWTMTRAGEIEYAAKNGVLIPDVAKKSEFSTDENLWGRSVEAGVLEDPTKAVVENAFLAAAVFVSSNA